jgi:hypothetical protein
MQQIKNDRFKERWRYLAKGFDQIRLGRLPEFFEGLAEAIV